MNRKIPNEHAQSPSELLSPPHTKSSPNDLLHPIQSSPPTPTKDESSGSQTTDEPYTIFSPLQKALIITLVSIAATLSGLASNIYFPILPTLAHDLSVSATKITLTVTTYLIFQALAPSLWGPISDVHGRRSAYLGTLLVFLAACIGLAETRSYAGLLVCRCVQSAGSASTIAVGAGVVGDLTRREDRAAWMGIFSAGLLVPTAVGPVIGGALAGGLGWRAVFWFLVIYSGSIWVGLVVLLPETLRSQVGNGGRTTGNWFVRFPLVIYQRRTKVAWTRREEGVTAPRARVDVWGPLRILVSRHAAPIIIFLAVYYAVWQMSISAMSTLFEDRYGLNETQIGLTFIANGVGTIGGSLTSGKLLNADYRRVKKVHDEQNHSTHLGGDPEKSSMAVHDDDDFPLERARLRLAPIFSLIQCFSIMLFGWSVQYAGKVHIAVPIVSTFITGWTAVSTQTIVTTYLVDIFPGQTAAAGASLNLARCLLAAGGTSFIIPMIDSIGCGLAFTICVILQAIGILCVVVQWRYGGVWRKRANVLNNT